MATELEQVDLDFVILADAVQVVNGKVNMLGGAWDRRFVDDFSKRVPIIIAAAILVPWNLTNRPHTIDIHLEDEGGVVIEPKARGQITVGRPPDAQAGQSFRAIAVINGSWMLPKPGTYSIVATVGGGGKKRTVFRAQQRVSAGARVGQ